MVKMMKKILRFIKSLYFNLRYPKMSKQFKLLVSSQKYMEEEPRLDISFKDCFLAEFDKYPRICE